MLFKRNPGTLRRALNKYMKKTYYLNEPKREVSEKTFVKKETLGDKVPETQADKKLREPKGKKIF